MRMPRNNRSQAFTLVELLVATAVTLIIMILAMQVVRGVTDIWSNQVRQSGARLVVVVNDAAREVERNMMQATVYPYLDYYDEDLVRRDPTGEDIRNFVPFIYGRASDLHFISGPDLFGGAGHHSHAAFFQSPLDHQPGEEGGTATGRLNAMGYFIRYDSQDPQRPDFIDPPDQPRHRFKLYKFFKPTDRLGVYSSNGTDRDWFADELAGDPPGSSFVVVENILAMAFFPDLPGLSETDRLLMLPGGLYDTRVSWSGGNQPIAAHQLPPAVEFILIAIEEDAAERLNAQFGATQPDFGLDWDQLFRSPANLPDDLEMLQEALNAFEFADGNVGISYRIVRGGIPILSARWSD